MPCLINGNKVFWSILDKEDKENWELVSCKELTIHV